MNYKLATIPLLILASQTRTLFCADSSKLPLHEALMRQEPIVLSTISSLCTSDAINNRDSKGRNALYLAVTNAKYVEFAVFENLLQKGAEMHIGTYRDPNDTPMAHAARLQAEALANLHTQQQQHQDATAEQTMVTILQQINTLFKNTYDTDTRKKIAYINGHLEWSNFKPVSTLFLLP